MNHSLKPERIEALDALGMIWEHPRTSIEHRLDIARGYHAQHGHLSPVPGERFRGMDIGRWINTCRTKARRGQLPDCYQRPSPRSTPGGTPTGTSTATGGASTHALSQPPAAANWHFPTLPPTATTDRWSSGSTSNSKSCPP